ncbi:hypothetical protein PBN151_0141 [Paenibacillus sp. NAIST15-1]|nr:hypothetical protein PBN151_0141 [Paenibacillus sp. NAIST15-1]
MNMITSMGVVGDVHLFIRILSVSSAFRSGSNLYWSGFSWVQLILMLHKVY